MHIPKFYVYFYLRSDGTPYYVGKGSGVRAFQHHRRLGKAPALHEIILQHYPDEASAYAAETFFIEFFGRKDTGTGTLANLTDGGEGACNMSEAGRARLRISGKRMGAINGVSPENIKHLARIRTPEHQAAAARISGKKNVENGHLARLRTPEHQAAAGRISGKANVAKGHMARIAVLGGRAAGPANGRKRVESGGLAKLRTPEHQAYAGGFAGRKQAANGNLERARHTRWHVYRNTQQHGCRFCEAA